MLKSGTFRKLIKLLVLVFVLCHWSLEVSAKAVTKLEKTAGTKSTNHVRMPDCVTSKAHAQEQIKNSKFF